jgi:hypothetical protein
MDMPEKTVFFTSDQGNGSIIIDEALAQDHDKVRARILDVTGITHSVKIVDSLPPVLENVTVEALVLVLDEYNRTKSRIIGIEDTSLWDLKYDLAKKALADDKNAQDTLKTMLTKKDFDANKKDALTAIKSVAKKIVEKQDKYRLQVLSLDGILRNYKQSVESLSDAAAISAAMETAIRQLKLLVKE